MADRHIIVDASIEDLKAGASLWVVLYPNTRREGQPNIESYLLKHVMISGDDFWGSFGSIHHSDTLHQTAVFHEQDADGINASIPCAYAYSNHCEFVCNFSYIMGVMRFYDSHAYSRIHFRQKNNHQLVWSSGESQTFDNLYACVESGRQLKISVTDEQGLTLILPVHTPEVYLEEGRARLLTEMDALPKALHDEDALKEVNTALVNAIADRADKVDPKDQNYPATSLINGQFDSIFYSIDCFSSGVITASRWDINQKDFITNGVGAVQVFAEMPNE